MNPNSHFNPNGQSESIRILSEKVYNPFESSLIPKSFQISMRINPTSNQINPIESETKPN